MNKIYLGFLLLLALPMGLSIDANDDSYYCDTGEILIVGPPSVVSGGRWQCVELNVSLFNFSMVNITNNLSASYIATDGSSTTTAVIPFAQPIRVDSITSYTSDDTVKFPGGVWIPEEESYFFGGTGFIDAKAYMAVTDQVLYIGQPFLPDSINTVNFNGVDVTLDENVSLLDDKQIKIGTTESLRIYKSSADGRYYFEEVPQYANPIMMSQPFFMNGYELDFGDGVWYQGIGRFGVKAIYDDTIPEWRLENIDVVPAGSAWHMYNFSNATFSYNEMPVLFLDNKHATMELNGSFEVEEQITINGSEVCTAKNGLCNSTATPWLNSTEYLTFASVVNSDNMTIYFHYPNGSLITDSKRTARVWFSSTSNMIDSYPIAVDYDIGGMDNSQFWFNSYVTSFEGQIVTNTLGYSKLKFYGYGAGLNELFVLIDYGGRWFVSPTWFTTG